jgi:ABC-type Fe3+-hydroxamate transport system substrate-binding protein
MRVVSCVPSLSELVEDLAPGRLCGRTRYCIAPDSIRKIAKIGGTKDLDTEGIIALNPDLVLSVKEENERDQILKIRGAGIRTEVFDIRTLDDAITMVRECGKLLDNQSRAEEISAGMESIRLLKEIRGTVLYFIWQNPWMCAGKDTFIGSLLDSCGFVNLAPEGDRYPVLHDISEIEKLNPDYIFLSSEPFPFREKHRLDFANNFPDSEVKLVDGSIFSWYGVRTTQLPGYLKELNLRSAGPAKSPDGFFSTIS